MNWEKKAIAYLRSYESLRAACSNLPLQLKRLQNRIYRARNGECQQEQLLEDLELARKLRQNLEQSRSWLNMIDRALEKLPHREQLVLKRMYIFPESGGVERACLDLGVERATVYRYRQLALRRFTAVLFGSAESAPQT